jgi:hypothetical protein
MHRAFEPAMNLLSDMTMVANRPPVSPAGRARGDPLGHAIPVQRDTERGVDLGRGAFGDDATASRVPVEHLQPLVAQVFGDRSHVVLGRSMALVEFVGGKESAFVWRRILPVLQIRQIGAPGLTPQKQRDCDALCLVDRADQD